MRHVGHHAHAHDHIVPSVDRDRRDRLAIATGANIAIAALEVAAGIVLGSIALLADAAHQAVDALALLVSMAAVVLASRRPTPRRSFGWRRADVLGAQLSALLLLATTVWIAYESILRLGDPPSLDGAAVAVVAAITLVLNAACALFLRSHGKHSMAVRAAVLHLATDAASSAAVLVAGVLIAVTGADWLDPAVSLAISVVVALSTIRLLTATSHVLLEGAPVGIDPHAVEQALGELDGVDDVHHLHLWSLAPDEPSLSVHLRCADAVSLHDAQVTVAEAEAMLAERFSIHHTTIQAECHDCERADHIG
jgi:cobalt-zinc-cadmium efflux system protein